MALAVKRIILVTQNVQFAIDVKRALEALGEYSVTTAANARNAIEFLREHQADLLLLDMLGLPISPGIMIELVRARSADIAIVLAPDQPAVRQLAGEYAAKAVVDIPIFARDLLPVLEAALATRPDSLPQLPVDSAPASQDTREIEALVDALVPEDIPLNYTRRRLQASYELLHPRAAEPASTVQAVVELRIDPPDENDTIRFHTTSIADDFDESTLESGTDDTIRDLGLRLASAPRAGAELITAPQSASPIDDSAAFQQMLNNLLDESTQLDDLKLESLFDTTAELVGALGTGAVPRWLRETELLISEPEFLNRLLPRVDEAPFQATEAAAQKSTASRETEPATAPDDETVPSAEPKSDPESNTETATDEDWLPLSSQDKDPLLAQLALTMTQSLTELSADATVLSKGQSIHAFSGEMPLDSFRALRQVIADDWAAQGEQSRLRFIRLPDGSAHYMLYSRSTIAGFCLTLIFSGERQLSEIRQQGDALSQALAAAPATPPDKPALPEEPPTPEVDTQPFSFVWLLADPDLPLPKAVAEQVLFWLELQLNSLGWRIHRLDVHGDYIYLYADVPGNASPDALIRDVMERSRQIACAEDQALPQELWADAYLVLQPGRAISDRELGRFLQFARA
ncbi:MAG: response regulator [Chloroflexi bacterium]|nr:response regulator [Chloroflexota bacterium]MCY3583896.1 response regulator [Chloroflexota bacterium]MCY3717622.1 response regulator [Chloroflexota bacterium]MDE2651253.1 response regulator [Chloroflexota bacterium]MYA93771.1 response regulator [Chloroflexota bacterium]